MPRHRVFDDEDEEDHFEDDEEDEEDEEMYDFRDRRLARDSDTQYQMREFEQAIPYEVDDLGRFPVEESDEEIENHDSGSIYDDENQEEWDQDEVQLLHATNPQYYGQNPMVERLETLYMNQQPQMVQERFEEEALISQSLHQTQETQISQMMLQNQIDEERPHSENSGSEHDELTQNFEPLSTFANREQAVEYIIRSSDIEERLNQSENRVNTEVLMSCSKDQYPFNAKNTNLTGVLNAFVQDPQRDQLEQDLKKVFEGMCKKFKNKEPFKKIVEVLDPSQSRAKKLIKLQKRQRDLFSSRLELGNIDSIPEELLNGLLEHLRQHNRFDGPTRLIIEGQGGNLVTHFYGRDEIEEQEEDEDDDDEEEQSNLLRHPRYARNEQGIFESPVPRSFFNRDQTQEREVDSLFQVMERSTRLMQQLNRLPGFEDPLQRPRDPLAPMLQQQQAQAELAAQERQNSELIEDQILQQIQILEDEVDEPEIDSQAQQTLNPNNTSNPDPLSFQNLVEDRGSDFSSQHVSEEEIERPESDSRIRIHSENSLRSLTGFLDSLNIPMQAQTGQNQQNMANSGIGSFDLSFLRSRNLPPQNQGGSVNLNVLGNQESLNPLPTAEIHPHGIIVEEEGEHDEEQMIDESHENQSDDQTQEHSPSGQFMIEESQNNLDEVQNHNALMPSRASPAPELINSSNLSRNELISPDPRHDQAEGSNYVPINTVFEDVIAEESENEQEGDQEEQLSSHHRSETATNDNPSIIPSEMTQDSTFADDNQQLRSRQNSFIEIPDTQVVAQNLDLNHQASVERLETNPSTVENIPNQAEANLIEVNFDFSIVGMPSNFLELAGIDREFFVQLPYDLQMDVVITNMPDVQTQIELIAQIQLNSRRPEEPVSDARITQVPANNGSIPFPNPTPPQPVNTVNNTNNNTRANSGNNTGQNTGNNTGTNTAINTNNNSPRRNHSSGATVGRQITENVIAEQNQPQNENMLFLESLTIDLRNEVLMTCPDDFLLGLPEATRLEARQLRERNQQSSLNQMVRRNLVGGYFAPPPQMRMPPPLPNLMSFRHAMGLDAFGGSDEFLRSADNLFERQLLQRDRFLGLERKPLSKRFSLSEKLATKINQVDQKVVSGIIRLIICSKEIDTFEFEFAVACCMNTLNRERLLSALLFLLVNPNSTQLKDSPLVENTIYSKGIAAITGVQMSKTYVTSLLKILEGLSYSYQNSLSSIFKGQILSHSHPEVEKLLATNSQSVNYKRGTIDDVIDLLQRPDIYQNELNVILTLKLIFNVVSESYKVEDSKKDLVDSELQLSKTNINKLCTLLNNKFIKQKAFVILTEIISILCFDEKNLGSFIEQLTQTIFQLSCNLNSKMGSDIEILSNCVAYPTLEQKEIIEYSIIKRQNEINSEELRLFKMFKMILKLYEKSLEQAKDEAEVDQEGQSQSEQVGTGNATQTNTAKTSPSKQEKQEKQDKMTAQVRSKFMSLMKDDNLRNLWLNICESVNYLDEIFRESKKVMKPAIEGMKPLIESFFIMYRILCDDEMIENIKMFYKKTKTKDSTVKKIATLKVAGFEEDLEQDILNQTFSQLRNTDLGIDQLLLIMCEKNRKVLNVIIRDNIGLLSESLSVIPKKMPKILDFENKRSYFKLRQENRRSYGRIPITVRRSNIFADSYHAIMSRTPDELKVILEFTGEEGMDAGGVSREWFNLLSKEIFDPGYALFIPSANGGTYQPSPHSYVNPDHIRYFKFVGRVIGKALHDGYFMDSFFTRSFYKHITGTSLTYDDFEDIDPDYYKNLRWILDNDITGLDMNFTYEFDNFGKVEVKELKTGGKDIEVTNENKEEYVHLICYEKMATVIKAQIEAFLDGLHDLIPKDLVAIFDHRELELMISGLPEIDLADLRIHTVYHNFKKDDQHILWFWEILSEFDREMKANFLQYVTGTSKVPVDGFKSLVGISGPQQFQIHKAFDTNLLPTSHTCMNQLDLPMYRTKEEMKEKLVTAINWGKEGFGFV